MSVKKLTHEDRILSFYEKNVYGNVLIYCYDEDVAAVLKTLTNKKTVDRYDLEALSKLGLRVQLTKLPNQNG